jgi:hypothetical protein
MVICSEFFVQDKDGLTQAKTNDGYCFESLGGMSIVLWFNQIFTFRVRRCISHKS